MPDKYVSVENAYHRLQQLVRKNLMCLPGTKMLQGVLTHAPSDARRHTILNNCSWWAAAHMYSAQILNHSPNISTKHTHTALGQVVPLSSHQMFYNDIKSVTDLDSFHSFLERCSVYDLARDLKVDPVREDCIFIGRESDATWFVQDKEIRHMRGVIVVQVSTGRTVYTGKVHFDKVKPVDTRVYNVTVPVNAIANFDNEDDDTLLRPSPLFKSGEVETFIDKYAASLQEVRTTPSEGESIHTILIGINNVI